LHKPRAGHPSAQEDVGTQHARNTRRLEFREFCPHLDIVSPFATRGADSARLRARRSYAVVSRPEGRMPTATWRPRELDHWLHDPGYTRARMPACSSASAVCMAATPEPQ